MTTKWTAKRVLTRLKARRKAGRALGYRALAEADRKLLSAAVYYFKTYANALEALGIDTDAVSKRPRWTKERVIRQIKAARRAKRDLCWAAVMKRRDPLRRAAYAGMRLFGSWARTLQAAGVDGDDFRRYRIWDRESVAFDLKQRHADSEPVSSAAVQADDPGLYSAAMRYFGSYDRALRAARLAPGKVRVRKKPQANASTRT